jgi:hypothetical protein
MSYENKDRFWSPKSVYKGTNADGSKFTVEEWDYFSLKGGGYTGIMNALVYFALTVVASPILLIVAVFTHNGKVQFSNILGFIFGLYFMIDSLNDWFITDFAKIFLSNSVLTILIRINIAAFICHIVLIIFIFGKKDEFNQDGHMWVLLIVMIVCFVPLYRMTANMNPVGMPEKTMSVDKAKRIVEQSYELYRNLDNLGINATDADYEKINDWKVRNNFEEADKVYSEYLYKQIPASASGKEGENIDF